MRKRERQKRLDKEYTIESNCINEKERNEIQFKNCIKREREKDKRNWQGSIFIV